MDAPTSCKNYTNSPLNLQDITKVVEFHSSDEANKYLDAGWKLLLVCNISCSITSPCTEPCYVLGWVGADPVCPSLFPDYGDPSDYV